MQQCTLIGPRFPSILKRSFLETSGESINKFSPTLLINSILQYYFKFGRCAPQDYVFCSLLARNTSIFMQIFVQISNNNNNITDSRKGHQILSFSMCLLLLNFLLIVYLVKGPCFPIIILIKKLFNFK